MKDCFKCRSYDDWSWCGKARAYIWEVDFCKYFEVRGSASSIKTREAT